MDIQSSIRDINQTTKEITATISSDTIAARLEASLTKLAMNAKIKGFRPGKAPRALIEKTFEERLFREVTTDLAGEALVKVVREHALKLVGEPEVEFAPAQKGAPLTFSAQVYVLPEPSVEGAEQFAVKVHKQEAGDEQIDQALERLRKEHVLVIPTEGKRYAESGDIVEFTARLVNTKSVNAKSSGEAPQPLRVELGAETLPFELDAALRSLAVGGAKRITIKPQAKSRRAQTAMSYDITITSIGQKGLRDIDDEFAKVVDPAVEGLAQLRETIREKLQANFDAQAKDAVRTEVLNQLVARNQFDVPPPLIDRELASMAQQLGGGDGSSLSINAIREVLGTVAADRVRAQVIVDQIAKKEGLTAAAEEMSATIARQAETMGQPVATLERWIASSPDRLRVVEREVVRTKVLDLLESRASVEYSAEPLVNETSSERDEGDTVAETSFESANQPLVTE